MFKTRSLSFGRPTALFPRVLNARFASEAGLPILPHVARASDLHPCFPGCFPLGHATSEKFWISRFSRFAWCIHMLERHGETKYIESIFPAMPQPGTSSGMLDDVVFATWLKPRHVATTSEHACDSSNAGQEAREVSQEKAFEVVNVEGLWWAVWTYNIP